MNISTESLISDSETEFWNCIDDQLVSKEIEKLPEEYKTAQYFTILDLPNEFKIERLTPNGFVAVGGMFVAFNDVWEVLPF